MPGFFTRDHQRPIPKAELHNGEGRDEYLIGDIACITGYYHHFAGAILGIEKLRQAEVDHSVASCYYRMLYVNVITALTTYLSDAFISTLVGNSGLMRRFVEATLEFRGEKVVSADASKTLDDVERKARVLLSGLAWHQIERVRQMYRDNLGIEFPAEIGAVSQGMRTHHDIVHRNGTARDGAEVRISSEDVAKLIQIVEELVQDIDVQLADFRAWPSSEPRPRVA